MLAEPTVLFLFVGMVLWIFSLAKIVTVERLAHLPANFFVVMEWLNPVRNVMMELPTLAQSLMLADP